MFSENRSPLGANAALRVGIMPKLHDRANRARLQEGQAD
jgi:hypothetical protein